MRDRRICVLILVLGVTASLAAVPGEQTAPATTDLLVRVGLTADEAATARAGQAVVRVLPANASTEVAAVGAIRIRGDLERLVAWLRDIEDFRRAAGTDNVGTFGRPARPQDFARTAAAGLNLDELQRCRPGNCAIRMPAAYLTRFRTEVPWGTAQAGTVAVALAQQLLSDYATAYQTGGDAALGAHHDQSAPTAIAAEFQDMLRRATALWNLAYPFARYLETFPNDHPPDTEDRFYWTREIGARQPMTTLHHVVLQRLADASVRLADKRFYASRDFDTGLLVGQATPLADRTSFDLVISVRARSARLGGLAARVLRGRIEREVADTLGMYLNWLQRNYALG